MSDAIPIPQGATVGVPIPQGAEIGDPGTSPSLLATAEHYGKQFLTHMGTAANSLYPIRLTKGIIGRASGAPGSKEAMGDIATDAIRDFAVAGAGAGDESAPASRRITKPTEVGPQSLRGIPRGAQSEGLGKVPVNTPEPALALGEAPARRPIFPGAPLPEHPGMFPGAHLPEHPGTFPGAHLPEKPPSEVFQGRGLATGGKPTPPSPARPLGKIPLRPQSFDDVPSDIRETRDIQDQVRNQAEGMDNQVLEQDAREHMSAQMPRKANRLNVIEKANSAPIEASAETSKPVSRVAKPNVEMPETDDLSPILRKSLAVARKAKK